MIRRTFVALCLAAVPLAQAAGGPLPDPTYATTFNQVQVGSTPGNYGAGGLTGTIATVPQPMIHAHLEGQGTSFVEEIYWFRVVGPAGVEVPIQISGAIHIDLVGAVFQQNKIWGTTAQLIGQSYDGEILGGGFVNQVDYQLATLDCNPGAEGPIASPPPIATCSGTKQDANPVLILKTKPGGDNRVVMNAAVNNQEAFHASFDSVVDPIISFAPGFDSTGFTIIFNEGIGNSAPEPGAALLVLLGALTLAGARRESVHR
jgi:hypothetical protein